ncbi:heparinase [Sphingobacterium sp. SGG-5]|uniref:heparinase II/III domain-containing protein n=1 Tax=Sphingobacterium sp. SGG-5 TaxID=2710881 RepID=UPI0013ED06DE|nr:heparinase II/III family protein [Sphingobacterium sp. SGG-5]NGM61038.1 heparinase [Sphingobacterium sp. SGG-5]
MMMYRKLFLFGYTFFILCTFSITLKAQQQDDDIAEAFAQLSEKIRPDHPRVFINEGMLRDLQAKSVGVNREHFDAMKNRIDNIINRDIVFNDLSITDGTRSKDHEYGYIASDAALIYLITGDLKYFNYTKKVLIKLNEYYAARNEQNLNIHWRAYTRISALAAFDWIYAGLTERERREIGRPLLEAIDKMVFLHGRKSAPRENRGDYKSGFYGNPVLAWYAGLVFDKTGINDPMASTLLKQGFEDHWRLLRYRKQVAGDDGGAATAVMEYNIQAYPWAEFNFFHSVKSATGVDISQRWTSPLDLLYYTVWNWLPKKHHVGYGDVDHIANQLPLLHMYAHLTQMRHFYGKNHPNIIPLLLWVGAKVKQYPSDVFPFARYLVDYTLDEKNVPPVSEELTGLPSAMHFENMGQIFMRSGSGPNDTYASFSAGGILTQHRHYDNNNFVIYRNGFRALDSGTRPEPGQHLTHYYCRTVAHNCITIRMPGEEFPEYWGGPASSETPLPIPNDGGQRELLGSKVVGYSQNKQYVYIASDATKSYHQDKAQTILRQFVFIQPDIFVVFDKVVSKSADYPKTWLLHTASEPVFVKDNEFYETSQGGTLFCRTVFPAEAQATKIGGPGKQFWSDGRNWPLPLLTPDDWNYRPNSPERYKNLTTKPLLGQWRVEVSPKNPNLKDRFLHIIQVGDDKLKSMVTSKAVEKDHKKGVAFDYAGKSYEILFNDDDTVGGHIRISKGGNTLRNEAFTSQVEPQESIFKIR